MGKGNPLLVLVFKPGLGWVAWTMAQQEKYEEAGV
jgi:hypothetical protein